tara:strand:+ start:2946 stop:3398 length:453 start_codon:yes stop_codon:yes gene_type:complete
MNLMIARLALNLLKAGKLQKLKKLAMQFNVKNPDDASRFIQKAHKTVVGTPSSKVRPVIDSVKTRKATKNIWAPKGYFTEKFYKKGYFHKDKFGEGADMGKSDWEVFDMLRRDLNPSKKTMKSWFGPKMPKKMKEDLLNEDFGLLDLMDY